jgi:hypothetical protein
LFKNSTATGEDGKFYVGTEIALVIENEARFSFAAEFDVTVDEVIICDVVSDQLYLVYCRADVGACDVLQQNFIPALLMNEKLTKFDENLSATLTCSSGISK